MYLCNELAYLGKRVIVSGLNADYETVPFKTTMDLVSIAEYVDKLLAICVKCGNQATINKRIIANNNRIVVGDSEAYEARCRDCYLKGL